MLPNFIIIGAARCATTWLSSNLMKHPEVFMHPKKELHFFDRDYSKGIEFYKEYFKIKKEKAVGEATPAYLYFEHIPALIKRHIPDVKIVASLRNPVDRAYSHYLNIISKRKNQQKHETFEEMITNYSRITHEGFYYQMLKRYYDNFPKEQIHVLIYEEILENPEKNLKTLYDFISVNPLLNSQVIRHKINSAAIKNGRSKLGYYIYLFFLKKLKFYGIAEKIGMKTKKDIPKMNIQTQKNLYKLYENRNKELEGLLKKDLTLWNYKS